jgi:ectoine hydroxylase-related dioxygenase (phytanoyl-CoA dioxygenase family)
MAGVLDHPVMNGYVQQLLAPSCIMYAYQSSSAPPSGSNYGQRIHVDSPRFIPDYMTNLGVILPLDDFTAENGATRYLPGSQKKEELPDEELFNLNCKTAQCKAGDMIIFNARLAHSTGFNHTDLFRHALTINFCRCFMRQRFDFCRMPQADEAFMQSLGDHGKRLLGYNVRMPTSLEEFYLPVEKRLYKPNQE